MRAELAENSAEPVSMLDAMANRFSPAELYPLVKSNVNASSDGNKNESSEMPERIMAIGVADMTDEFGHEGHPRGDVEMKKSLLATVATVALIAGTGLVSAESAKEGMKAGAAASGAAAVKSEPAMKTGADIKSGAAVKGKHETIGAGVESKSEMKSEMKSEPKAEMKSDMKAVSKADVKADSKADTKASTSGQASEQKMAPAAKSNTTANEKAAPAAKSAADSKADTKSNAAAADTKSGASGSASLTTEQKTKIRTTVLQSSSAPKVSRSQINFNISVGTVVPRSVHFVTVPQTIIEIHPAWRGYSYFVVDDEIIIVEPGTFRIIAVLNV